MSTFAQVLPTSASHFSHHQDFFPAPSYVYYPPNGEYDGSRLLSEALAGYCSNDALPSSSIFAPLPDQSISSISPQLISTSPRYGGSSRRSSHVSSPASSSMRERTPIRHHRPPSTVRSRAASRPDVLLAYAQEQQQGQVVPQATPPLPQLRHSPQTFSQQPTPQPLPPVLPSQSRGNTPPSYHTSPGARLAATYQTQGEYYGGQQQQHQTYPFDGSVYHTTDFPYRPLGIDHHHHSLPTTLNPSESIYQPQLHPLSHQQQPQPASIPSSTSLPSLNHHHQQNPFPPPAAPLLSTTSTTNNNLFGPVPISSRPKPQCFSHGCNGRQFSTFSNLLRHQREKSGSANKALCPHCGSEFTRTTARNGHLRGGKCKGLPEGNVPGDEDNLGDDGSEG